MEYFRQDKFLKEYDLCQNALHGRLSRLQDWHTQKCVQVKPDFLDTFVILSLRWPP